MTDDALARAIAHEARSGGKYASTLLAETFRKRRDLDVERRRFIAETAYAILRSGPLPEWLLARLRADFGADAEALIRGLGEAPSTDVRANPARASRDALIAELGREGIAAVALPRTTFGARILPGARDLYATRAFREGMFEVQDEGSQLVAELVAPSPGALVIDACAGEGGKTLAIGALLGGRGRIVACDVSEKKLEALRARAKRAGLNNVQTIAIEREGELPPQLAKLRADRVLVDAPCTGIGTLRRNPEMRYRLDAEGPARLAAEQRAIALRFAPLVEKGGRMIYATCTVLREEDEGTAEAIVAATDLRPMRAAEIWGTARAAPLSDPSVTYLRLFPHVQGTDGFFAAVLRRAK
jgi:16S rRNA (cytosine967-C5)-methyltransferase